MRSITVRDIATICNADVATAETAQLGSPVTREDVTVADLMALYNADASHGGRQPAPIADHQRPDGTWCPWSLCETRHAEGACPDQCPAATSATTSTTAA